jgi:microcystin-dependent protein
MADPFVAEIRIFPFNFAPKGWAWCNGQLMPISQNTALFSLLGTTYGGNGTSNFALPNMQGNAPMHPGQGPGLSLHDLGETGGSETITLLESEIPSHSHTLMSVTSFAGSANDPTGNVLAKATAGAPLNAYIPFAQGSTPLAAMAPQAISPAGGDQPHNNMMPYLTLNFNIALQGVFPPRT